MRIAAIGIFLLAASSARSATIEPYTCRNGFFPSDQADLRQAKVLGSKGQKLAFYSDDKACPDGGGKCETKAYVLAGDELLVNKVRGSWACVWFHGKKQETVGWVDAARLEILPKDEPADWRRWTGKWTLYQDTDVINISAAKGQLRVKGAAHWYGGKTPEGEPIVNFGDIEGALAPQGRKAHLVTEDGPDACQADFTLVGNYLVVADNSNCGGMNVKFDGIYVKRK